MPDNVMRRSKKVGLLPGTLIHVGEKKTEKVRVTVIQYDKTNYHEYEAERFDETLVPAGKESITWVNVEGLHQIDLIQKICDFYGLHPLVQEDILHTGQRTKLEDYTEYLYIVLRMFHNLTGDKTVAEQISLILGPHFVISFQEGMTGDVFNAIRERIKTGKGRLRSMDSDYLVYSLIDAIVDNYFIILEKAGEDVEDLEKELLVEPSPETLKKIHNLKQDILFLRKSTWSLREVISVLERGESPLIKKPTRVYLRDVYDHAVQVIDTIETSREMLSGMLDIYLSSISHRMNEIIKFLTIIGTIFMPLTFIVGIYGMNFEHMPELKWRWGYFAILGVIAVIGCSLLLYFSKKKWL